MARLRSEGVRLWLLDLAAAPKEEAARAHDGASLGGRRPRCTRLSRNVSGNEFVPATGAVFNGPVTEPKMETIDTSNLTLELAEEMAAVKAACLADVDIAPDTGPALLLAATVGSGEPADDLAVLARVDDRLVAWGRLVEPRREYTDTAFLDGYVGPAQQGRGLGRTLLDMLGDRTVRPRLRARAWHDTSGTAALPALGFSPQLTHVVRRLFLDTPDPRWSALRRQAEGAAADYELVRRVGATPEADLPEMAVLREAINDAPDALEYEAYPPERISSYEQALEARRQTQYAVIARHRATGEPAGITLCDVDEFSPSVAHQEDTSVVRAHRGHRLGLLLKLEMIDWLREVRPEVTATDTWNDQTNHHMIAVNEQLGTRVVAASTAFTRAR
jgi:GNAT superfamily N-acetyltransferase